MNFLDIIFILIFLYIFARSIYRGLILSLANVLSFISGIYLFKTYFSPINTWIQNGAIGKLTINILKNSNIYKDSKAFDSSVLSFIDNIKTSISSLNLPEALESFITQKIDISLASNSNISNYFYSTISEIIIGILTSIIIVLLINILTIFIINIAKITKRLPIIKSFDRLSGAFLGILKGSIAIIMLYLLIIVIYIINPSFSFSLGGQNIAFADILDSSLIARFLNKSSLINAILSFLYHL